MRVPSWIPKISKKYCDVKTCLPSLKGKASIMWDTGFIKYHIADSEVGHGRVGEHLGSKKIDIEAASSPSYTLQGYPRCYQEHCTQPLQSACMGINIEENVIFSTDMKEKATQSTIYNKRVDLPDTVLCTVHYSQFTPHPF